MIYAESAKEIETRRKAFLRKWRLKCQAVADSLEEAGEALFAFTRLPSSQWKSARTTNAIERLHEEFKRRIKTQTVLPRFRPGPRTPTAKGALEQVTLGRPVPAPAPGGAGQGRPDSLEGKVPGAGSRRPHGASRQGRRRGPDGDREVLERRTPSLGLEQVGLPESLGRSLERDHQPRQKRRKHHDVVHQ